MELGKRERERLLVSPNLISQKLNKRPLNLTNHSRIGVSEHGSPENIPWESHILENYIFIMYIVYHVVVNYLAIKGTEKNK